MRKRRHSDDETNSPKKKIQRPEPDRERLTAMDVATGGTALPLDLWQLVAQFDRDLVSVSILKPDRNIRAVRSRNGVTYIVRFPVDRQTAVSCLDDQDRETTVGYVDLYDTHSIEIAENGRLYAQSDNRPVIHAYDTIRVPEDNKYKGVFQTCESKADIHLSWPSHCAFTIDPAGTTLYTICATAPTTLTLQCYDLARRRAISQHVLKGVDTRCDSLAFNARTKKLEVLCLGNLYEVDTQTGQVSKPLFVRGQQVGTDSQGLVYVASLDSLIVLQPDRSEVHRQQLVTQPQNGLFDVDSDGRVRYGDLDKGLFLLC